MLPQQTFSTQPSRILLPEKSSDHNDHDDECEEDDLETYEYDNEFEEEAGEIEEENDDEIETSSVASTIQTIPQQITSQQATQPAPKRKQRTKKVYPPSDNMFEQLIKSLCEMRELTRKVITLSRETEKCVNREMRELRNQVKKQKGEKPKRKPRGFALPSPISNELVDYLLNVAKITQVDRKVSDQVIGQVKIEYGCSLARNELTSALCQHFRDSGMRKNEQDRRDIYLDPLTTKLFGIDAKKFAEEGGRISPNKEPIITYFDLQKFLPRHCGRQALGH
jgi:hypothetical protein